MTSNDAPLTPSPGNKNFLTCHDKKRIVGTTTFYRRCEL